MKLPVSLAPDYSDARQRFIDVDGASFNGGADAASHIRRSFRTPAFKAVTLVGIVFGAAATFLARRYGGGPESIGPVFLTLSAAYPYIHAALYRKECPTREEEFPTLKRVLIDKSGRAPPNPEATLEVDEYYQSEVAFRTRFIAVIPAVAAAAVSVVQVITNAPPGLAAGVCAFTASSGLVPNAAHLVWALYARHQLHRPERPWTVTTDPPPLTRKAPSPARRQLALASVPARGRAP